MTDIYAEAMGSGPGRLDAEEMLDQACRSAKLGCFGTSASEIERFRHDFSILCSSLNEEANLSEIGYRRARSRLHMMLVTRLRSIEQRTAQKDFDTRLISSPLIGTGLPRSGTTFLHGLLACDPAHRAVRAWEAMLSPELLGYDIASPASLFQEHLAFQGFTGEESTAIHPFDANLPEECVFLQETNCSSLYAEFFNVPRFADAVANNSSLDLEWQKGQMKLLQGLDTVRRWVLKAPSHLFNWEEMVLAFPDALIYMSHRDPAKVIPSVTGLTVSIRGLFADAPPDAKAIAKERLTGWSAAVANVTRWRDRHPERFVADVYFLDLIARPLETVAGLYDTFGLKLSEQARTAMLRFIDRDRDNRSRRQHYTLAEYGLDEMAIDAAFADYLCRYGVALERD